MKRWRVVALVVLVVAGAAIASSRILFFHRDNFATHYPVKDLTATILRSGDLPLWNPQVGGGEPLGGNPNTLTFYPDTLLYLVLPARVAFNLHFILHALLGIAAMFGLLRARGVSRPSAAAGALLYLVSGVVASSFSFYNLVTAIALVPMTFLLVERLVARPSWRRGLELGAVAGLIGLAGEPVTVLAVGGACLVLVAGRFEERHRLSVAVALVTALLVASPLLVAWNEIRRGVERGFASYSSETVLATSVSPTRAVEMLFGPFRGVATDGSYVAPEGRKWPPFFLSLYVGILLVPALGVWSPGAWREKLLALMLFAGLLGEFNPLVRALVEGSPWLRIVRYPEKLAIPFTVIAIVLIALLLDARVLGRGEAILSALGFALIALVGIAVVAGAMDLSEAARSRLVVGLAVAVATLGCCAFRGSGTIPRVVMVALPVLFGATWFVRTIPVDRAGPYLDPSPVARAVSGERIYRDSSTLPVARRTTARAEYRERAFSIDSVFGVVHNVAYAGERSPDGMYSYLSRIVNERLDSVPLALRIRYLRVLGCRAWVTTLDLSDPGLRMRDAIASDEDETVRVYSILDPLPTVMVPRVAIGVRSVQDAVRVIEGEGFDEREAVVVAESRARAALAPAVVSDVTATTQEIGFHVAAAGDTILLVNQTYFDAWEARSGDRHFATFPADIDRLAFQVPRGEWDVTLRFGRKRAKIVLLALVSLALLALSAISAATNPDRYGLGCAKP